MRDVALICVSSGAFGLGLWTQLRLDLVFRGKNAAVHPRLLGSEHKRNRQGHTR